MRGDPLILIITSLHPYSHPATPDMEGLMPTTEPAYIPMYKPGHMLENGKYRLECMLGEGTYAEVWLATDTADGSLVAIKIKKWRITTEITIGRFEDEKLAAMKLGKCPYIIAARAFLRWKEGDREMLAIVYEYIEGGETLWGRSSTQKPSEYEVLRVSTDMLKGLVAAHARGIIHRDLKPENVLMSPETDPPTAMIGDFGVAAVSNHSGDRRTRAQTQFGTPAFTPPEQWFDVRLATPRSDLFSLGVMIAELMDVDSLAADGEVNTWLDESRRQAWLAQLTNPRIRAIVEMATMNEFVDGKVVVRRFASASIMLIAVEVVMAEMSKDEPPWTPRESAGPIAPAEAEGDGNRASPTAVPEQEPVRRYGTVIDRSGVVPPVDNDPEPEPPSRRGWIGVVAGIVGLVAVMGVAMAFWPKGQPDAPEPVKEAATVETPIVDPPKPEPLAVVTPKVEPKPKSPIVTPTPVVEVAPVAKVEVKPKVEPKPVVKPPVVKPPPEESKPEVAKVTTAAATITTHPATAKVGAKIEIVAKVAIPDGTTVKSVKLYYRGETGAYQNLTAALDGTTAKATLPINIGFGAAVTYYIDVRLEGDSVPHKSAVATTTIVQ